jgi:hypothetical protein
MTSEITVSGKPFIHHHSAHCESGVISALLRDKGLEISEAMGFGIGSGIFFGYFPFIKWVGLPISTFRSRPGTLIKNIVICKKAWTICATRFPKATLLV